MRVIPIGVNSAFATGEYMEAITLIDLQEILQSGTENILEQVIKKLKTLYDPRLQSNFLLEFDNAVLKNKDATKIYVNKPIIRILVDAGGDARHGLKRRNLTVNDIDVFYVSHPHSDHIGGIECAALMSFFNPFYNKQKKHGLSDNNMNILSYILKGGNVPSHWKPILMGQEEVIEETPIITQEVETQIATVTNEGTTDEIIIPEETGNGAVAENPETPFVSVEEMPSFPGGEEALFKYLGKNINFPAMEKDAGISGTVYVYFVINKEGKTTGVASSKGINLNL